jgi:hypothetical protein
MIPIYFFNIIINKDILNENDNTLFKDIFPIFRGIGLIILYNMLLAWNVYGWSKYQVNYKLIFQFGNHASDINDILTRGAFFSVIFLIMFMWYIMIALDGFLARYIDWLPKEYTPLVVWICFILYIFFPSKKYFNPEGRKYFINILKEIIYTPFMPLTFRIIWASD